MNRLFSEIKIHFCINRQIDFGKAVYVSGNISELGSWQYKPNLRLEWNEVRHFLT
jgi:hypothetical protein